MRRDQRPARPGKQGAVLRAAAAIIGSIMRRGLCSVLMLLLVLRGLTGGAMAAGMVLPLASAQQHQPLGHTQQHRIAEHRMPQQQTPGQQHPHGAATASQHGGDAQTRPAAQSACAGAGVAVAAGHCPAQEQHAGNCADCAVCHSAMLAPPVCAVQTGVRAAPGLPQAAARFVSAAAALPVKPPGF